MDTPRPTNPPDPELVQAIYAVGQTYWLSYNLCIRIADACEAHLELAGVPPTTKDENE